mmetsp:Transcript_18157/g.37811  ORF Transcript_18157/g.37811 Transcript_18157/m.37811 type:complete len:246 (+) Transcript_18157:440-1177(+)
MDRFLAKNRVAASRARSEVVNLRQRLATCSSELLKIYDFVDREKILLEKSPSETDWIDSAYARVLRRLEVASPPQGFDRNAMEQASHLLREMQKAEASEVLALQAAIDELLAREAEAYNEIDGKESYFLFGVFVHDGEPAGGHYIAFIKNLGDDQWTKFSDLNALTLSTEEVSRASFGGTSKASAYSLLYLRNDEIQNRVTDVGDEARSLLPTRIVRDVEAKNKRFTEDLEDAWEKPDQHESIAP